MKSPMSHRFRSYMPVVIDIETGGFNAQTDAMLEIAAVFIDMDNQGRLRVGETVSTHVEPFPGANMEPASLEITGIDPYNPLRGAIPEKAALDKLLQPIRTVMKGHDCTKSILVGHNAFFDLNFLNAAIARTNYKRNPFHPFSNFDTVSLAGMAYGQTVLAKACEAAGIE